MSISLIATYILSFLFVLGVLIFIHELGHFLVARFFGIKVHVFSLGFGKRLIGFRYFDTDYRISLIPLGGYVKMAGENPEDGLTGSPDEFLSRPKIERFWVAVAGPAMNLILAVLLLAGTFMIGQEVLEYLIKPPIVGAVAPDSPALKSGIQSGDTIISINGRSMPRWKDVEFRIAINPDRTLDIEFQRKDKKLSTSLITQETQDGRGTIGISPFIPYVISRVIPNSAAQKSGLKTGDEIVSVHKNGQRNIGFSAIAQTIKASEGTPLLFEILRNGELIFQTISPEIIEGKPRLGAYIQYATREEQLEPMEAFQQSLKDNYEMTILTFATIGRLLTGTSSVKQLSGPIEIAKFSGRAATLGLVPLLSLMAVISLQLGLLNLLPIPILDGGMILLLTIEGIMGRDLSLRIKDQIFKIGFMLIVLLMGIVLVNDLAKNFAAF